MFAEKRAQAAMEFLMTYGWAILAVLVVIGALAFFGVTNPLNLLPDKCVLQLPFECNDYQAIAGTPNGKIALQVANSGGKDVNITRVWFTSSTALISDCGYNPGATGIILLNGAQLEMTDSSCGVVNTARAKDRFSITIQYNYVGSPFFHNATGELVAKVEG